MLCHQCGSPIQATDRSCPNCGASLVKTGRFDIATSKGIRISQELKAIRLDDQVFPPGEKLAGRYAIGELIGKGPFGEVYKAHDEDLDVDVAVKVFAKALIPNPHRQEKFLAAARVARSLSQANLVRVHDSGVHKGYAWVSMQYLEGLSLRKVLGLRRTKGENFGLDEIEPVVTQISLALAASEKGTACVTLKPENIIFMPDLLKITDTFLFPAFGLEALQERLQESNYLAPELHTPGAEADVRADVYSLGVIIGEMAFGSDYSPGGGTPGMEALDALCQRATAFSREERYPTVDALVEDLTTLVDTGSLMEPFVAPPPPAPPTPPPAPRTGEQAILPPPAPLAAPAKAETTEELEDDEIDEIVDDAAGQAPGDGDEDISTVEYTREKDLEIQDLLATNEVKRGANRRPEVPRGPATRVNTMTVNTQAPAPTDDNRVTWVVAGVAVVALAVFFAYMLPGKGSDEVVQLGSHNKAAADSPRVEKPVTNNAQAPSVQTAAQVTAAQTAQAPSSFTAMQVDFNQTAAQATNNAPSTQTAAQMAAQPVVAFNTPTTATATQVAAVTPVTEKPADPVVTPTKVETKVEAKVEDTPTPPAEKVAATGTKCPTGSVLVKAKAGNYCVDAYEYPGSGAPPKTRVNWFEAKKLCAAAGKRLCTLGEWKGACGSKYPYGSSFDANACNTADEDGFERSIASAGANKKCRSKSGTYDMSGNVYEWVEERRVAGGSYESDEEVSSCRYSSAKAPGSSSADIGFRCCADPE